MQIENPQYRKRRRRTEPSLWVEEPADDALSLLENALREDEPAFCGDDHNDQVNWLLEENARLRKLLAQMSELNR